MKKFCDLCMQASQKNTANWVVQGKIGCYGTSLERDGVAYLCETCYAEHTRAGYKKGEKI